MGQLTAILQKEKKEWIPINEEEIESIALKISYGKRKRTNFTSYKTGEVRTIFHELIGTYGFRKYSRVKGMLAVQTNPYLYSYLVLPKYTQIQINGRRFAYVLANGMIKNSNGKKVIGHIDKTDVNHPEILIGDNNFGILNRPSVRAKPHERAVQLMRGMPEGVQELFVSTLLLYLISHQSELKAFRDL